MELRTAGGVVAGRRQIEVDGDDRGRLEPPVDLHHADEADQQQPVDDLAVDAAGAVRLLCACAATTPDEQQPHGRSLGTTAVVVLDRGLATVTDDAGRSRGFQTPAPGRLVGGGRARSHGVEALVRKKLARDVYGLASYAYAVSRYTAATGVERNRSFDHRHVASLMVG